MWVGSEGEMGKWSGGGGVPESGGEERGDWWVVLMEVW